MCERYYYAVGMYVHVYFLVAQFTFPDFATKNVATKNVLLFRGAKRLTSSETKTKHKPKNKFFMTTDYCSCVLFIQLLNLTEIPIADEKVTFAHIKQVKWIADFNNEHE